MKRILSILILTISIVYAQAPFGNVLRISQLDQCAINSSAYLAPGATQMGAAGAMNTMNGPITIEFLFHSCTTPDSTGYGVFYFNGNSSSATVMGGNDWNTDPLTLFGRLYSQSLGVDAYEGFSPAPTNFTSMGWHHIVFEFVFDPTYDRNIIYVGFDGVPYTWNPFDDTNFNAWKGYNFSIGKLPTGLGIFNVMKSMKGSYDEVRITNGPRYNLGGTLPGGNTLVIPTAEFVSDAQTYALWHFNEAAGDTIMQDDSGNNFDMLGVNGAMVVSPVIGGNLYAFSIDSICYGSSITLTGANNYSWSPSYGLSDPFHSSPIFLLADTAVSYALSGLDINTCVIYYDSLTVVGLGSDIFNNDSTGFCDGTSVMLDAGSGYAGYQWSNAANTQSISVSTPGMYSVDVNVSGCTFSDSIYVETYPLTTVNIGPDIYSCYGDSVHIDPIVIGNPILYTWHTGSNLGYHTIFSPGDTISITVTDVNGCLSMDTVYSFSGSTNHIDGVIRTHDALPFVYTKVYAVTYDTTISELIVVDSTSTNLYGEYEFYPTVVPLAIMVVPDSINYPNEAPTYHYGSYIYHSDSTLNLEACVDTSLSFYSIELAQISGPIDVPGTFIIGGRAVGDPIPNAKLFLVNNLGETVQYLKTNASGYFNFKDLVPGEYWFWADIPYVDNLLAPSIILNELDSSNLQSIQLGLFTDHLEIIQLNYLEIENEEEKIPTVSFAYPNPADDVIYVHNPTSDGLDLYIYNSLGQRIMQTFLQKSTTIDCSVWPTSIYYIEYRNSNELIGLQKILIR